MSRLLPSDSPSPATTFATSCGVTVLVLLCGVIATNDAQTLFAEGGPIESLSAFFLMVAALWVSVEIATRRRACLWHIAVLLWAATLRELDLDKAFTQSGILSLRLYSGDAPVIQKLVGAGVLALLLLAGMRLISRNLSEFVANLPKLRSQEWVLALGIVLLSIAKILDGLGRKLAFWGVEISRWLGTMASRIEESLEMLAALLILQVVALYRVRNGA